MKNKRDIYLGEESEIERNKFKLEKYEIEKKYSLAFKIIIGLIIIFVLSSIGFIYFSTNKASDTEKVWVASTYLVNSITFLVVGVCLKKEGQ